MNLACFNGAKWDKSPGVCSCGFGYTGTYCGTFIGCAASGQFACLNGGSCNANTGTCQCATGYTGAYCSSIFTTSTSTCLFLSNILILWLLFVISECSNVLPKVL
jgi:hypothetical protein